METVSSVGRGSYDYYHLNKKAGENEGKTIERKARTPWYYRDLSAEGINSSNNVPNKDYECADICRNVAEKLEAAAEANRRKYASADEVKNAVWAKYGVGGRYKNLSSEERGALARAEIKMTLHGTVNVGDARIIAGIKGDTTKNTLGRNEADNRAFNAAMLGKQIGNVLRNNGFDLSLLGNNRFLISVDGMGKKLSIMLSDNNGKAAACGSAINGIGSVINEMEKALNSGDNAKNLFYNLLYDYNRQGIIPAAQLAKWSLFSDFKNVTGLDIRDFKQTEAGFVNDDGQFVRDIYKNELRHSRISPEFRGAAYDYFIKLEEDALKYNIGEVTDLTLSLEYQGGCVRLSGSAETFDVGV